MMRQCEGYSPVPQNAPFYRGKRILRRDFLYHRKLCLPSRFIISHAPLSNESSINPWGAVVKRFLIKNAYTTYIYARKVCGNAPARGFLFDFFTFS